MSAARKNPKEVSASYIDHMHDAVRGQFMGATDLPTFLNQAGGLSCEDRQRIVGQALLLIEQNYVHLPLKRAMYAIDPAQRLKLLLQRLEQTPESAMNLFRRIRPSLALSSFFGVDFSLRNFH